MAAIVSPLFRWLKIYRAVDGSAVTSLRGNFRFKIEPTAATNPSPCKTCQNLDLPGPMGENEVRFRRKDLKQSAQQGCTTCAMVHEALRRSCRSYWVGIHNHHVVLKFENEQRPLEVDIHWAESVDFRLLRLCRTQCLQFYTHAGEPTIWPAIGTGGTISRDPLSDDCIGLASKWIKDCVESESHTNCQRLKSTPLPTRVIHVGSDRVNPYLYVSSGENVHYVCLSYPWGDQNHFMTTKATLESYQKEISFNALPKTLQDAIIVTRALGLSYIWIDALCIIQDCQSDWAHEAGKMADVFRNSFITIAAAAATDSHSGFLVRRSRELGVVTIKSRVAEKKHTSAYIRQRPITPMKYSNSYSGVEIAHNAEYRNRSKLSSRGWVLQERMLAPRTLLFEKDELAWDCRSKVACECTDGGARAKGDPRKTNLEIGSFTSWESTVEEFSDRDLTIPTDRLSAISGIAAVNQLTRNDTYISGLWQRELARGLIWSVSVWSRRASRRQETYIAPSWSWASITGIVTYDLLECFQVSSTFRVLEASCNLASENLFGPAKAAHLVISGLTVPIKVHRLTNPMEKRNDYPYLFPYGLSKGGNVDYDMIRFDSMRLDVHGSYHRHGDSYKSTFSEDNLEIHPNEQLMAILVGESGGGGWSYELVLRASREKPGFYERVGCWRGVDKTLMWSSSAKMKTLKII